MINKYYYDILNTNSTEDVVNEFHSTIIDTNRGHKFFVDWDKIQKKMKNYKIELNILSSLIKTNNFDEELKKILKKYPEVLPVIPILIAVRYRTLRKGKLKVISDFLDEDSDIIQYNFKNRKLSSTEINKFLLFFKKTGLKYFFKNISQNSLYDYVSGVEVGMDTHARKNRSGKAMELVLKPIIEEIIAEKPNYDLYFQKAFKILNKHDFKIGSDIKNRKADFIIVKDNSKIINIEVNFYSGSGSKPQEIVDSYINRQNDLHDYGFEFIWITDGYGWKEQKNQIRKGFNQVDYLMNLSFVRDGLLERILCQL